MGRATRIILIQIDIYSNNEKKTIFILRWNAQVLLWMLWVYNIFFGMYMNPNQFQFDMILEKKKNRMNLLCVEFNWMLRIIICKCHYSLQEILQILIANWCANSVSFIIIILSKNMPIAQSVKSNGRKTKCIFFRCSTSMSVEAFSCLFHDQSLIKIRFYRLESAQFVKHANSIACVLHFYFWKCFFTVLIFLSKSFELNRQFI